VVGVDVARRVMTQTHVTPALVGAVRGFRLAVARAKGMGRLRIGEGSLIGPRFRISRSGRLTVGRRVGIGADFQVMADVTIGDDVMVSGQVAIIGDDHPFDASDRTIRDHEARPPAHVVLEGDNLIGYGSILVGPLVVGRGTVVGAGSVVVGDLPANSVCAGVPAKVLRRRRTA
jgi:acetyltransferase-like isoleucine patch superfamily enzyme